MIKPLCAYQPNEHSLGLEVVIKCMRFGRMVLQREDSVLSLITYQTRGHEGLLIKSQKNVYRSKIRSCMFQIPCSESQVLKNPGILLQLWGDIGS